MTTYFPVSLREYDRLKRENDLIEREEESQSVDETDEETEPLKP